MELSKTTISAILLVTLFALSSSTDREPEIREEIVEIVVSEIEVDAVTTIYDDATTTPRIIHDNDTTTSINNWTTSTSTTPKPKKTVSVASLNWEQVKNYLIISLFLIVVCVAKFGFHKAKFLAKFIPESCLLVVLGVIAGAIMYGARLDPSKFQLSSELFFNVLLPPIILDSAYSLHDRVFFHNLGTVLLMAVIGTIVNIFILGLIDWGLAMAGAMGELDITLTQCFIFSAPIASVDPVAVLAIFQEISVNNVIYFLVFGESLLNDGVTVVMYNTMLDYNEMDEIPGEQIGLGITAFFVVSLGGLVIGVAVGVVTSFFTRFTNFLGVMEPLIMFIFAYASYLLANLFGLSGIISIIGCGLIQAHYAFNNVTDDSLVTIKNLSQTLSTTCDCVMFMFVGLSLVSDNHVWHTGFCLWNIVLCLVIRFLGVYVLTFLANFFRIRKVTKEEQFIMAYGGMRGAVSFALVVMLEVDEVTMPYEMKQMFLTTTLAIIIFSIFIQGISMKPIVKLFRISKSIERVESMALEVNDHVTDFLMVSMEHIIGNKGQHHFRESLVYFDTKYLKKWLQNIPQTRDVAILERHRQVSVLEMHRQVSVLEYMNDSYDASETDSTSSTSLNKMDLESGLKSSPTVNFYIPDEDD